MKRAAKRTKATPRRSLGRRRLRAKQTAIVHVPQPAAIQRTSDVPRVMETVKDLELVRRFVINCMNVDLKRAEERAKLLGKKLSEEERQALEVDWGTIPNVDKPFLKQPGAEKYNFWLKLKPKYHKQTTELEGGHLEMVCHVSLLTKKGGEEIFEGPDASCTTMESNYRFRWRKCEGNEKDPVPSEAEQAQLKREGRGRWQLTQEWIHGVKQKEKVWKWFERVNNPNIWDERNKVRQMGEKRGLVKAVRGCGAMSELFVASPDEWDVGPEEEGSPVVDADHTESGRRVVNEQGFAPSGKPVTQEAYHEQGQAIARAKAEELRRKMEQEEKQPPAQPKSDYVQKVEQEYEENRVVYLIRTKTSNDVRVLGWLGDGAMEEFLGNVNAKRIEDELDRSVSWKFGQEYVPKFNAVCQQLKINVEKIGP